MLYQASKYNIACGFVPYVHKFHTSSKRWRFVSKSLHKTHPVGLMAATPYPRRLLLQLPARLDGPSILAVLPHSALFAATSEIGRTSTLVVEES
ncbi:hypothetical protein WN51_00331 [Melipona quadrifasciata]|uniref:Uncharacterized protein n=1 Tax=Melipona quadrifasciata TaxID=166423 RepID=A0A0M8ZXN3_9HYME|nr:hypothetical protein WN51_00331 [Melipona quadrifasciata]